MTLHPDVLTDLVILYHAGEASQASRELLEKEALQNPAVAAALAARPRVMQPIEAAPMISEREVLKRVRRHYLYRALVAIGVALALITIFAIVRSERPTLGSSHLSGEAPSKTPKATSEPR
jgi:branched-subunit amino acid ABC-type transport system permease component